MKRLDRFMANVIIEDGHWFWKGSKKVPTGCIKINFDQATGVRVAAWVLTGHEMSDELRPRVTCGEPGCINPDHHELKQINNRKPKTTVWTI